MSSDLFLTSLIPWFRDQPHQVLHAIAEVSQIKQEVLEQGFRTDPVLAAEPQKHVPPAVERLFRWDLRPPFDIFNNGFQPFLSPYEGDPYPDQYDLDSFVQVNAASVFVSTTRYHRIVQVNRPSVFVSTTRYHRDSPANTLDIWERRVTEETNHRFLYEIFSYSGIIVDRVLIDPPFPQQHEVIFPGGIDRRCIRTAREYVGNTIVAYWDSPNFDISVNGKYAPTTPLPHIIRRGTAPVYLFPYDHGAPNPPPSHEHEELRKKREAGKDDPELDLMLHVGAEDSDTITDSP